VLAWFVFCGVFVAQAQNLESVLDSMDKAAANFHNAQCDFVADSYQKVVDEHDLQKGTMYFRRQGDGMEMAADFTAPDKKYVLFSNGTVSYYQPPSTRSRSTAPARTRPRSKASWSWDSAAAGHDLTNSYDVTYGGNEQVEGINAAKLVLTPKSPRVRNMFQTITCGSIPRAESRCNRGLTSLQAITASPSTAISRSITRSPATFSS
jgi:outer membrane lipoprotein-sorting protein